MGNDDSTEYSSNDWLFIHFIILYYYLLFIIPCTHTYSASVNCFDNKSLLLYAIPSNTPYLLWQSCKSLVPIGIHLFFFAVEHRFQYLHNDIIWRKCLVSSSFICTIKPSRSMFILWDPLNILAVVFSISIETLSRDNICWFSGGIKNDSFLGQTVCILAPLFRNKGIEGPQMTAIKIMQQAINAPTALCRFILLNWFSCKWLKNV